MTKIWNVWHEINKGKAGAIAWAQDETGDIVVKVKNPTIGETMEVRLDAFCARGFHDWLQGDHIDHALKMVSPLTRTLLLSGYADNA